jgi:hypothetical protein
MPNKPEDFPVFTHISQETVKSFIEKLNQYLSNFPDSHGIHDIAANMNIMYEVAERIEKRRVYFHIFYDVSMGELNEISLVCFWILKLHPFFSKSLQSDVLNTKIAIYLFLTTVSYAARESGKHVNTSGKLVENLYYAFRFRDLSKEAIMALAESLIYGDEA